MFLFFRGPVAERPGTGPVRSSFASTVLRPSIHV